ncbi:MAG: glutamate--tRNA ligase [Desulfovibrionaceae bacterium]|nr:glutamate--tRNA ligase [Desulfovibrionaceae bacterium]MBF0514999.1 glutamate--tRNA ligase [Desulfovibrionaceae bacterium]
MTQVVTRFAPSPTGHLHIGGARTAIFNWLFARRHGGTFLLRIEDTDQLRSTQEMTDSILASMRWLGLDYDGEPSYQSKRFDVYNERIDELLASGGAYWCSCTPDEVEAMREQARARGLKPKYDGKCRRAGLGPGPGRVVRLAAPLTGTTLVADVVKGPVVFENAELDDMILRRADGTPTYNLAVVVDDASMDVTHVIRGDDHLNNTPKQILIYQALGLPLPHFGHVPMILGPDKKKMSKRHGATSVIDYRRDGYLPEALVNYLVRLGWSHGDQEIFSLAGLREVFSLEALGKSASVFNPEKLLWLNAHYIKEAPVARLAGLVNDVLGERGRPAADPDYLSAIIPLLQARSQTLVEMADKAACFLAADDALPIDAEAAAKFLTPEIKDHLLAIVAMLSALDGFGHAELEAAFNAYLETKAVKFKVLAQPIRVALTGSTASPGLFEMMEVLGEKRVLARLRRAATLC